MLNSKSNNITLYTQNMAWNLKKKLYILTDPKNIEQKQ